ncbi:MAG: T9SS type A sorting domain-containing protein [Chitinophagales bacterium]
MKTFFTSLFILFSCATSIYAQEPTMLSLKGYGGNGDDQVATHVIKTQDGGFIIQVGSNSTVGTGNIDSFCILSGYRSIFLKYNADASVLEWSKCYGNGGDSAFMYMFPANDGGLVLGGEFIHGISGGFLICKEDVLGNVVWSHNYSKGNGGGLSDMISTDDGGFIMAGLSNRTDTNVLIHYGSLGHDDIWVLKVDSNGNKVWSIVVGGTYDEAVFSVIPGPAGGCYIFGSTNSDDYDCTGYHGSVPGGPAGPDAYLARLDSNGNILWHHDLGGSAYDGENGWGTADGKGGVLLANSSNSTDGDVHHNTGNYDYWVLEVDSSNNILWDNSYGGGGNPYPMSICKATDGSIWINGLSNGQGGEIDTVYDVLNGDAWLVHADSAGNFLNAKVLGSLGYDKGTMVYSLSNGFVMAGGFYSENNGSFSSLMSYGSFPSVDAFLAVFAPWATAVNNIEKQKGNVVMFPNPADELLTIEVTNEQYEYNLIINDLLGREIFAGKIPLNKKGITINVSGWAKGVYYVQVVSDGGYRITEKILIQ